jgi:predicted ester cyclase
MKKLLMAIIACEVILACGNKTSNSASDAATQQNLEAVHNISKAFETGDTSLINKSVAKDFIDHKDYGDVKGIDSLKAFILASHEHIKNLKMELIKELADDEYVMSWVQFKGTGDGQENTVQGNFNVRGMEITRFKNGKAVEHWEAMDMRDVSKMIKQLLS